MKLLPILLLSQTDARKYKWKKKPQGNILIFDKDIFKSFKFKHFLLIKIELIP